MDVLTRCWCKRGLEYVMLRLFTAHRGMCIGLVEHTSPPFILLAMPITRCSLALGDVSSGLADVLILLSSLPLQHLDVSVPSEGRGR